MGRSDSMDKMGRVSRLDQAEMEKAIAETFGISGSDRRRFPGSI